MDKSILDIQLMHWPRMGEGQSEDGTADSRLHDGTEHLIIVGARTLSEVLDNLVGLVSI